MNGLGREIAHPVDAHTTAFIWDFVENIEYCWIEDGLRVGLTDIDGELVQCLIVCITARKGHVGIVGQCSRQLVDLVHYRVGIVDIVHLGAAEHLPLLDEAGAKIGDYAKVVSATAEGKIQVRLGVFRDIDNRGVW